MFICMCLYICVLSCWCPQKPGKGLRSPVTGVLGDCELSDMDAANQAQVLCKSTTFS